MVCEKPSVNRRAGTRQPFVQLMWLLRTAWIWIGTIRLFDREPRRLRTDAGSHDPGDVHVRYSSLKQGHSDPVMGNHLRAVPRRSQARLLVEVGKVSAAKIEQSAEISLLNRQISVRLGPDTDRAHIFL